MFILIGQPGVKVHTNNIAMPHIVFFALILLKRNSKVKATTHDMCIVGRTKVNLLHILHVLYATCTWRDFPTVDVSILIYA